VRVKLLTSYSTVEEGVCAYRLDPFDCFRWSLILWTLNNSEVDWLKANANFKSSYTIFPVVSKELNDSYEVTSGHIFQKKSDDRTNEVPCFSNIEFSKNFSKDDF